MALGHVSRPLYRLCFSLWLKPSLGLRLRPKLFMEQPMGNWQGGDLARPEFSSGAFSWFHLHTPALGADLCPDALGWLS